MSEETIVAVYDTAAHAAAAASDLVSTGVPSGAITQHAKGGTMSGASTTSTASAQGEGFWASLFGGEPTQEHDTDVYDRSLAGGSTLLTVKAPADHVAAVLATLERHGPIDIDERGASYAGTQTLKPVVRDAATPAATDGKIQLAEESLVVGKRVVNRGTTRIRRYVVETPVEEQVRLHSEKVVVERRPVTDARPGTVDFSDKTLAMTETDEQAVVSKTARVVEEVGLRREAADRTETVRDTVRRQDVEIVQEPATTTTGGLAGTSTTPVKPRI
jgi:uncharacterized protein (TIGR02271 family)